MGDEREGEKEEEGGKEEERREEERKRRGRVEKSGVEQDKDTAGQKRERKVLCEAVCIEQQRNRYVVTGEEGANDNVE